MILSKIPRKVRSLLVLWPKFPEEPFRKAWIRNEGDKNWDWTISGRSWPFGRACSKKIILTRDSHLYQPEWSFLPAEDNLNWSRTQRRIPLSATSSWVCTSSRLQLTSSEFWSGPFSFLYLTWIKTIGITSASIMAKFIKIPYNWPPLNFDQGPLPSSTLLE